VGTSDIVLSLARRTPFWLKSSKPSKAAVIDIHEERSSNRRLQSQIFKDLNLLPNLRRLESPVSGDINNLASKVWKIWKNTTSHARARNGPTKS
jgi:hypothetical protein